MKNVRLIEIELHSYCNRKCEFCPNSYIDRTFKRRLNIEKLYINVIVPLKNIEYSGYISFSRYNEPLADREHLINVLKLFNLHLPKAKLVFNTNGDYNTKNIPYADITIMDYDNLLPFVPNDRGGSLKQYSKVKRTIPCYEPKYFIGVDYTGDVVPCCNIRGDNINHKKFIFGNIYNDSIISIYNNISSKKFRQNCELGNFSEICKYCSKKPGRYTRDKPDKNGDMT